MRTARPAARSKATILCSPQMALLPQDNVELGACASWKDRER